MRPHKSLVNGAPIRCERTANRLSTVPDTPDDLGDRPVCHVTDRQPRVLSKKQSKLSSVLELVAQIDHAETISPMILPPDAGSELTNRTNPLELDTTCARRQVEYLGETRHETLLIALPAAASQASSDRDKCGPVVAGRRGRTRTRTTIVGKARSQPVVAGTPRSSTATVSYRFGALCEAVQSSAAKPVIEAASPTLAIWPQLPST